MRKITVRDDYHIKKLEKYLKRLYPNSEILNLEFDMWDKKIKMEIDYRELEKNES